MSKKNKSIKQKYVENEKVFDENEASKPFLSSNKTSLETLSKKNKRELNDNKKVKVGKKLENKNDPIINKIKKHFDETVKETKEITQQNKKELNPNITQKIEEAQTDVKKSSSKVRIYFYTLCLLINVACFSFILFLLSSSAINLNSVLKKENLGWFIFTLFSSILIVLLDVLLLGIFLKRTTKKFRFPLCFKTVTIGRYYDCITPLKTGGQPFQISYLHKFGEKGNSSASVPMSRFVVNQFVYLIAIVVLLFNISKVRLIGTTTMSNIIGITAYVGLGIQLLWLITLIFLSYSKKIGPVMVIGVLKFLAKLRFIKNYRLAYVKVLRFVKEYQITMRKCLSNLGHFFLVIFISALIMVIKWSVPFFIYSSFCGFNLGIYPTMLAYTMLMELALGFWILPGNVVFADLVFLAFFRPIFASNLIFWALLLWRLLSYYVYIILGAMIKFYDIIKYEWMKKPYKKSSKSLTNLNIKKQNNQL